MLKLLNYESLETLAKHPERVVVKELVGICHQIFAVQSFVGAVGFIPAAAQHRLGMENILNVAIPVLGFLKTRPNTFDPKGYRFVSFTAGYWIVATVFNLLEFLWGLVSQDAGLALSAFIGVFVKTAISLVQWIAFARLWRLLQDENMKGGQFYLNIVIQNKEEVVQAGVEKKTGFGKAIGTRRLGRLAGALANRVVTPEKFGGNLGARLERSIPQRLAENGVTAKASLQFSRGNVVVMLVTVEAVDFKKIVTKQAGEERATKIEGWLQILPARLRNEFESFLMTRTAAGLIKQMPENIARQMQELGGLEVAVEARPPEEEAEYLFALLRALDEASDEPSSPGSRQS